MTVPIRPDSSLADKPNIEKTRHTRGLEVPRRTKTIESWREKREGTWNNFPNSVYGKIEEIKVPSHSSEERAGQSFPERRSTGKLTRPDVSRMCAMPVGCKLEAIRQFRIRLIRGSRSTGSSVLAIGEPMPVARSYPVAAAVKPATVVLPLPFTLAFLPIVMSWKYVR